MEQQMERKFQQADFASKLNQLIRDLSLNTIRSFLQSSNEQFADALFSLETTLNGKMEKDLMMAKKKILEAFVETSPLFSQEEIKSFHRRVLRLTQPTDHVIKEGIFTIYCELLEMSESLQKKAQNEDFLNFIEDILKELELSLRNYFILKKIDNNSGEKKSQKLVLSEKIINKQRSHGKIKIGSTTNIGNCKSYTEIKTELEKFTIDELIKIEMEGQQKSMSNKLETCRICEHQFCLIDLEKHVNYCSKKEVLRAKRGQIIEKQEEIIEQIKEELSKGVGDEKLAKTYRILIICHQKQEKSQRRSSLQLKKNQPTSDKFSFILEQYQNNLTDCPLLDKFCTLEQQKSIVDKKIGHTESQYIQSFNQISSDENTSLKQSNKNFRDKKSKSFKTKKSIFAPNKVENYSKKQDTQSQHSSSNQITTFKLKKWKTFTEKQSEEMLDLFEEEKKVYKSLTQIKFEEEKKVEIKFQSFEILKVLGKGAFGKVYLARRKNTLDIYAMKVIKIEQNWGNKELKLIENEHEIFRKIGGDHLVKASFSFNEGSAHFFILQYMPGGDFSKYLEEEVYLDNEKARFYLAEIILAIEHLHSFNIIHRDLKPQNLVFDEKGHIKLTDFGLSEIRISDKINRAKMLGSSYGEGPFLSGQKNTENGKCRQKLLEKKSNNKIIGTPDYIAPQIINHVSLDNPSVDWWSLGVLAYEMLIGCRPFADDTIDQVLENITEFKISWPEIGYEDDMIDPVATDLIKKLLNPKYEERLGASGADQIKSHPFFEGIDWEEIKNMNPPFLPNVQNSESQEIEGNEDLFYQIREITKENEKNPNLKLSNFVRYDLLKNETLESAEKTKVQHDRKISKLKIMAEGHERVSTRKRVSIEMKPTDLFMYLDQL